MKKILIGVGIFIAVLIIALIGISIYISTLINEDFIVEQIESNMNCRAEINELDVGLFSAVSSIGLNGVKIGPRDSVANKGIPQKDRKPMKGGVIEAGSISLALQFGPLLAKKFVLDKLVIDGAKLNLSIYANGGNNLNSLFKTPLVVGGKRNPALDKKPEKKDEKEKDDPEKGPKKAFTAADIPVAGTLKKIGLTNSNASIHLQKTGDTIQVQGLELLLTDIDIDGKDLANHNSAYFNLDTTVKVFNRSKQEKVKLILDSGAKIVPFETKSGKVNPNVRYQLTVKEGTTLHSFTVLDQLAGSLPVLKNIGLKMDQLAKKAVLQEDVKVVINYRRSLVRLINEPTFKTKHYDLGIRKGSWIRLNNSTHHMTGKVISSKAESDKGISHVDNEIAKQVKGDKAAAKKIRNKLLGSLVENDRIFLAFTSKGSLSSPQVTMLSNIPGISDLIKGAIGEAINSKINDKIKNIPGAKKATDALKNLF